MVSFGMMQARVGDEARAKAYRSNDLMVLGKALYVTKMTQPLVDLYNQIEKDNSQTRIKLTQLIYDRFDSKA